MGTAAWQDEAFRHQWTTLPEVLRRGELRASGDHHDVLGELPEALCARSNDASEAWRGAEEALKGFLETQTKTGALQSVPGEAELPEAARALAQVDPLLGEELGRLLDAHHEALDDFALAKERVVARVTDRMSLEQLVWATVHAAGLVPAEGKEAGKLSLPARCLLLALMRSGYSRVARIQWILQDATWPQTHHRRSQADGLGGVKAYARYRVAEDVLVPAANDAEQPAAARVACALATVAICPAETHASRRLAGQLRIRDATDPSLGDLSEQVWRRRGDMLHGIARADFDGWLAEAFQRAQHAVAALGPLVVPAAAPEPSPEDRRREPRVKSLNLVNVSDFTDAGLLTGLEVGKTLDLSHAGLRLEIHHPVPLRSILGLSLALGDELLEVQGEVRSVEVAGEDAYRVGVRFVDPSPETQEVIDAALRSAPAG
jgi:hypothetical protein